MGGAYGYEKVNYKLSKDIASKLYSEIREKSTTGYNRLRGLQAAD